MRKANSKDSGDAFNTVRLAGGIGNQMFQYAFGESLRNQSGINTKYDLSFYHSPSLTAGDVPREYGLGSLRTNIEEVSASELEVLGRIPKETPTFSINPFDWIRLFSDIVLGGPKRVDEGGFGYSPDYIFKDVANSYFIGYWQSPKYFETIESQIRSDFVPATPLSRDSLILLEKIRSQNSVCVNVRRGDFASNPKSNRFHGLMDAAYYSNALEFLRHSVETDEVYVFSDDPSWCAVNLRLSGEVRIIGHEHAGPHFSHYLHLMQACSAFVIPNSTFGWWGAWLSGVDSSQIVAPRNWFRDVSVNTDDLFPEGWLRV